VIVSISSGFVPEKKYIIKTVLNDFLGLTFDFEFTDSVSDYVITIDNDNQLIIKDSFFSKCNDPEEYLRVENVPKHVEYVRNEFTPEEDIPVIYGDGSVIVSRQNEKKTLTCGIDLFASSFFMLTRWEECVGEVRDHHKRFPGTASLAYKSGFIDRPVVNEYIEMLWSMLKSLGCEQKRKEREYKVILTHDIDHLRRWRNVYVLVKRLGKDLLLNRKVKNALSTLKSFYNSKINEKKDPFHTFDFLMTQSEKIGVKSHFFFMVGGSTKYDLKTPLTRERMTPIFHQIADRGHFIGFHPSYDSFDNPSLWKKEFDQLQSLCTQEIKSGRQHCLRFKIPTTWRIWEENGLAWDSSMGYACAEGFRCGTCFEFNVFDVLERREMGLIEKPLIVMDGTLFSYRKYNQNEILESITLLKEKIKKFKGNFVILWHNSSLCDGKDQLYKLIINNIRS